MSRTGRTSPLHIVRSFVDAERVHSRTGKLTNNTFGRFEEINGQNYYIIRLFSTDIIRHGENGFTDLRHGGFITRVTTDRLNVFSRFMVSAYIPRTANACSEMTVKIPSNTAFTFVDARTEQETHRFVSEDSPSIDVDSADWLRIFNS